MQGKLSDCFPTQRPRCFVIKNHVWKKLWLFSVPRAFYVNPTQLCWEYLNDTVIHFKDPCWTTSISWKVGPFFFLWLMSCSMRVFGLQSVSPPTLHRPDPAGQDLTKRLPSFACIWWKGTQKNTSLRGKTNDNVIGWLEALALCWECPDSGNGSQMTDYLNSFDTLSVAFWPLAFIQLKAVAKTEVELA